MKREQIAVIGLGYIGLPLSLSFAMKGSPVIGVDVNGGLVQEINAGITHHLESYQGKGISQILQEQLAKGNFRATTDYAEAIPHCGAVVVTVGIPIRSGVADTSWLDSAVRSIGAHLQKGHVVIIRSTVIPGATEHHIKPLLEEASGMQAGVDFYLAYCSERIAEGKAFEEFESMPTILGGLNEASASAAEEVIARVTTKAPIFRASDMKVVETSKVFENISRDVNIAMAQEFARFTEGQGIDIYEVVEMANTHKRVNLLTPGPGVGGYCLPNALYYLLPKAEELAVDLPLLRTARSVNDAVPKLLVEKTLQALRESGKEPSRCKVAVLGIAMKDYSSDDRISPPLEIVQLLLESGVQVAAFDPAVPTPYAFKVNHFEEAISGADALLILAKQEGIPFSQIGEWIGQASPDLFVLDTRHVYRADEVEVLGARYWGI